MAGLALMPLGHECIFQDGELLLGTMGSLDPALPCCAVAINAQAAHVHACLKNRAADGLRPCAAASSRQLPPSQLELTTVLSGCYLWDSVATSCRSHLPSLPGCMCLTASLPCFTTKQGKRCRTLVLICKVATKPSEASQCQICIASGSCRGFNMGPRILC